MNRRARKYGRRSFASLAASAPGNLEVLESQLGRAWLVNPLADDPQLAKIGIRAEECLSVDAWWLVRGRQIFVVVSGSNAARLGAGELAACWSERGPHARLNLWACINSPVVSKSQFVRALAAFLRCGVLGRRRLRHTIGRRFTKVGTLS